jgi:hypothetical protein
MDEQRYAGDSVVVGFGKIDGRRCVHSRTLPCWAARSRVRGAEGSQDHDLAMDQVRSSA